MDTTLLSDHGLVFTLSFLLHALLYFAVRRISLTVGLKSYLSLPRGDQAEWDSRIVSNVQAVLAFVGALRWIWADYSTIQGDSDFGEDFFQRDLLPSHTLSPSP